MQDERLVTTTLQKERLFEIAKYTQRPTRTRHGYSKDWSPVTVRQLSELGMVEIKHGSVVITDKGWLEIEGNG